ncbi:GNAT family N-acetyltransferase [Pseudaestuariivita sp.]|uniref:GNAT family N-acetyltransferase n=1 Tax=Pseudaestuariivita sp. TaxID=2211669 RepID=UPI004058729F
MSHPALTLRTATAEDFDAVDALLSRVYPKLLKDDYAPSVRVLVLPRISRAQMPLLTSGTYFVGEQAPLGIVTAGGWTRDRSDPLMAHVRHVVTDDRVLRQGHAKALLTHIFASAKSKGMTRMTCWSTFTAVPFYEAMGFAQVGPIDVPLDQGISFPAVHLTRKL